METLESMHTDILALEVLKVIEEQVNLDKDVTVKTTLENMGLDSLQTCQLELDLENKFELKPIQLGSAENCLDIANKLKKTESR
jgi:acyl carrier protein